MIDRRGFLAATGALAAGTLGANASAGDRPGAVRFCVFADIHYLPGSFPHPSVAWLDRILEHAAAEKCDFVIHCGDFAHRPKADRDYVEHYNAFRIPTYHVIGNHDDDGNTHDETLASYGMRCGHYFFDRGGFRFVVTDPNYVRWGATGRIDHYSGGNYYKANGKAGDVTGVMPPDQLDWLRDAIDGAPGPCVVFSHQSFERPRGGACANGREVRAIFDAANRKHPGRVRLAINGHHHCDHLRVLENVVYLDLNSASYQWLGPKYRHKKYPQSWLEEQGLGRTCPPILSWDDPLHAIVTVGQDGRIGIEGMKSRFSCGVRPEDVGFGLDACARETTPNVQSADMRMTY